MMAKCILAQEQNLVICTALRGDENTMYNSAKLINLGQPHRRHTSPRKIDMRHRATQGNGLGRWFWYYTPDLRRAKLFWDILFELNHKVGSV